MIYSNQYSELIIFEQSYATNNQRIIDTEDAEIEDLLISGLNVQYLYNKETHQFMWIDGEYFFSLTASLDKN